MKYGTMRGGEDRYLEFKEAPSFSRLIQGVLECKTIGTSMLRDVRNLVHECGNLLTQTCVRIGFRDEAHDAAPVLASGSPER
jgi:hypothetical protein